MSGGLNALPLALMHWRRAFAHVVRGPHHDTLRLQQRHYCFFQGWPWLGLAMTKLFIYIINNQMVDSHLFFIMGVNYFKYLPFWI